jgi:hypothetical protein
MPMTDPSMTNILVFLPKYLEKRRNWGLGGMGTVLRSLKPGEIRVSDCLMDCKGFSLKRIVQIRFNAVAADGTLPSDFSHL